MLVRHRRTRTTRHALVHLLVCAGALRSLQGAARVARWRPAQNTPCAPLRSVQLRRTVTNACHLSRLVVRMYLGRLVGRMGR